MTTRKINDIFIGRPPEATVPLPDAARGSETDRERDRGKKTVPICPWGSPRNQTGEGWGRKGTEKISNEPLPCRQMV